MEDAPSFTFDNKIITLTHDMTLHITHLYDDIDFQTIFLEDTSSSYFLQVMHIIFTKLISKVPDSLKFKLYLYQIPSGMIPNKFAKDALEILKPIILEHNKSRYTYERYLRSSREEQENDEKKPSSMFDIDPEDEKEKEHENDEKQ